MLIRVGKKVPHNSSVSYRCGINSLVLRRCRKMTVVTHLFRCMDSGDSRALDLDAAGNRCSALLPKAKAARAKKIRTGAI